MIYVLLNIVFSSFFVLCVKWVQDRREDVISVGAVNYITAGIMSVAVFFALPNAIVTWNGVLTGGINGICYFSAFFFLIAAIPSKGAANVAAVTRLSILLPIAVAILAWQERPTIVQGLGIVLACSSLMLIGRRVQRHLAIPGAPSVGGWSGFVALASLFVIAGGARVSQAMFKYVCGTNEKSAYLMVGFMVTAVASLFVLAIRRRRLTSFDWAIGTVLGMTNLLQTFFILKALQTLPGYVVFPATSAGGLAFTSLIAVTVLHERLERLNYIGLAIAVTSLALLRSA